MTTPRIGSLLGVGSGIGRVQSTIRASPEEDTRGGWYCQCLPRAAGRAYPADVSDQEIREFLASRRAKISPERAGLARYGSKRRVPGLRRDEVALLADISVEYYTRLERGEARGVSNDVLEAVSRALQLDEAERAHLIDLVRAANLQRPPRRSSAQQQLRPASGAPSTP